MTRLSDIAAAKVKEAVDSLQIPQAAKDQIEWEVMPAFTGEGLGYVPIFCIPVPHSPGDYELTMGSPGFDPHASQADVNDLTRRLVDALQRSADQRSRDSRSLSNGHGDRSTGGLIVP